MTSDVANLSVSSCAHSLMKTLSLVLLRHSFVQFLLADDFFIVVEEKVDNLVWKRDFRAIKFWKSLEYRGPDDPVSASFDRVFEIDLGLSNNRLIMAQ
jgi:hypothetical protein